VRYFVTPDFSRKMTGQPSEVTELLSSFINEIEKTTKNILINEGVNHVPPSILQNDIFVFNIRGQGLRVYASFGTDSEGQEYILLLDFTVQRKVTSPYPNFSPKNPGIHSKYNPKVNTMINPRVNTMLNPRVNTMINPRVNTAYSGPFVYTLDLRQEGFIVRASDNVELIFNFENDFIGLCIKANNDVYVLFDEKNEWIGFLVKAKEDLRLRFNLDNDWTGLIV